MFIRVVVASIVAEPDIEAGSCQFHARSEVSIVHHPNLRAIIPAMLKEHRYRIFVVVGDSMHRQDVAVLSRYFVLFKLETIFFNDLLKVVLSVVNRTD